MTVDKFGRQITQKRKNQIYLIEDAQQFQKELQQQWREEIETFKQLVSTHMNDLPTTIASNFKQDMRCPVIYQFAGIVDKDKYYLILNNHHTYIENSDGL